MDIDTVVAIAVATTVATTVSGLVNAIVGHFLLRRLERFLGKGPEARSKD
jgi:uncharacterized PurR-regulated membrane protein YhhQ (DUF165 family)